MKDVVPRRSKLKQIVRSQLFRQRIVALKKGRGSYHRNPRNQSKENF